MGTKCEALGDGDDEDKCIICHDAALTHLFSRCGHLSVCGGCAEKLKAGNGVSVSRDGRLRGLKCPICRKPVEDIIELRISGV